MQPVSPEQSTVVRTSRGLSIADTRITLYLILEYLHADWPPSLIKDWLGLTDTQIADVMAYIEAYREEVEQEYQEVVRQGEERRLYWEARLQEHLAHSTTDKPTPEQAALRARFESWKAQTAP